MSSSTAAARCTTSSSAALKSSPRCLLLQRQQLGQKQRRRQRQGKSAHRFRRLSANNVVRVLRKTEFWLYFYTAQVWVPKMWLLWLQVQPQMFVTAGALVNLRAAPVVARALAAGAVRVPPRTGLCSGIISAAFATCDLLKYSILYCYRRALRCVRGHVPPRRFVHILNDSCSCAVVLMRVVAVMQVDVTQSLTEYERAHAHMIRRDLIRNDI